MNVDVLWSNFLEQIKDELSPVLFNTWFSETKLHKLHNENAYIIVPLSIHKKHIMDNYYDLMIKVLSDVTGSNYDIVLWTEDDIEEDEEDNSVEVINNSVDNTIKQAPFHSNLMSKYTFDNFIVGNTNKFAHAAAVSVAENPGSMYNPLFIYGNSGLGRHI